MKRLNGQPVAQFMMCVGYAMSIADAEAIVAKPTDAARLSALKSWLMEHPCDDPLIYAQSSFDPFYVGYGKALADKRAQELKMLPPPATEPGHPDNPVLS